MKIDIDISVDSLAIKRRVSREQVIRITVLGKWTDLRRNRPFLSIGVMRGAIRIMKHMIVNSRRSSSPIRSRSNMMTQRVSIITYLFILFYKKWDEISLNARRYFGIFNWNWSDRPRTSSAYPQYWPPPLTFFHSVFFISVIAVPLNFVQKGLKTRQCYLVVTTFVSILSQFSSRNHNETEFNFVFSVRQIL